MKQENLTENICDKGSSNNVNLSSLPSDNVGYSRDINLIYANINGAMARHELIENEVKVSNPDIVCLTETHYKSDIDVLILSNYSS